MDIHKQLQKIIDLLTEKKINYDALMLNLQVVEHYLHNSDFSFWIMSEINGYKEKTELPDYRIISTVLLGDFITLAPGGMMRYTNQPLLLPASKKIRDEITCYYCRESISKLMSYCENPTKVKIGASVSLRFAPEIQSQYDSEISINEMWQHLEVADLIGVVNSFKSKVLEFILNLNDDSNLNLNFDKPTTQLIITNYVKAAVYADNGSNVNITDSSIDVDK